MKGKVGGMGAFWQKMLILAAGGVLGTIGRYLMAGWLYRVLGERFAWGTLGVNVLGCFIIGLGMTLAQEKFLFSPQVRLFLFVGFCGAFTTFSTWIFESSQYLRDGQWLLTGLNLVGSVALGFAAFYLGVVLARWL